MAFRVITDKDEMDALWHAGLLWCRDYLDRDRGWGEWWVDRAEDWESKKGNEPSLYNSAQPFEFAILLED